jgi:hypothetical protein
MSYIETIMTTFFTPIDTKFTPDHVLLLGNRKLLYHINYYLGEVGGTSEISRHAPRYFTSSNVVELNEDYPLIKESFVTKYDNDDETVLMLFVLLSNGEGKFDLYCWCVNKKITDHTQTVSVNDFINTDVRKQMRECIERRKYTTRDGNIRILVCSYMCQPPHQNDAICVISDVNSVVHHQYVENVDGIPIIKSRVTITRGTFSKTILIDEHFSPDDFFTDDVENNDATLVVNPTDAIVYASEIITVRYDQYKSQLLINTFDGDFTVETGKLSSVLSINYDIVDKNILIIVRSEEIEQDITKHITIDQHEITIVDEKRLIGVSMDGVSIKTLPEKTFYRKKHFNVFYSNYRQQCCINVCNDQSEIIIRPVNVHSQEDAHRIIYHGTQSMYIRDNGNMHCVTPYMKFESLFEF